MGQTDCLCPNTTGPDPRKQRRVEMELKLYRLLAWLSSSSNAFATKKWASFCIHRSDLHHRALDHHTCYRACCSFIPINLPRKEINWLYPLKSICVPILDHCTCLPLSSRLVCQIFWCNWWCASKGAKPSLLRESTGPYCACLSNRALIFGISVRNFKLIGKPTRIVS